MRLKETTGNSRESGRLRESHETQGDYWVLMIISETKGDDETQGKYLGLMRFLILIKTKGDSLVSERLMRLREIHETSETHRDS